MKKKLWSSLLLALCVLFVCVLPAFADSRRVVTLGADLTPEQQNTMLRYFGVTKDAADIIYITNQDERDHLGSYVPIEQIGTHTFSCALVAPTTSGGIQVKTANLNWVTCNMIASTLSTSGVTNCQVVAASPFTVSGTGALTGVIMAYENASGKTLDTEKKELANQELVTTGNLANTVGQSKATAVVNETKIQVVENNITDIGEIYNIINNVSNEYNVSMTEDQSDEIAALMQKIAEQEYDIIQLKATLERVQANVAGDAGASEEQQAAVEALAQEAEKKAEEMAKELEAEEEKSGGIGGFINSIFGGVEKIPEETESILDNTDVGALEEAAGGMTVNEGDTTTTVQEQLEEQQEQTENFGIPEATGDGSINIEGGETTDPQAPAADPTVDLQAPVTDPAADPAAPTDDGMTLDPADLQAPAETEAPLAPESEAVEPGVTVDELAEGDKAIYNEIKKALDETVKTTMGGDDGYQMSMTDDAAKKVPELVEKYVLNVLAKGGDAIAMEEAANPEIPQDIMAETSLYAEDRSYVDNDLKQIDKFVRRLIFKDSEKILEDSWLEDVDKEFLYGEVMKILEKAYKVEPQTEAPETEGFVEDGGEPVEDMLPEDGGEFAEDFPEEDFGGDEFADFDEAEGTF